LVVHGGLYELVFKYFWGKGFYRVVRYIFMEGEKFKAVCSECKAECEIPFEPKEGRPVKCNDCFKKGRPQRDFNGGGNRGGGNRGGGFDRNNRRDVDVTCAECGKATTVPFKPTPGGKPVLCRDCFRASKN